MSTTTLALVLAGAFVAGLLLRAIATDLGRGIAKGIAIAQSTSGDTVSRSEAHLAIRDAVGVAACAFGDDEDERLEDLVELVTADLDAGRLAHRVANAEAER